MRAVDLFAGLGGFTCGAKAAGVNVVWAANHWQLAVDTHQANHPDVAHACQDLHQADWSAVPTHDVLLASPACQGHSRARGKDRAHHDATRSTAWAVVSCAEAHRPQIVLVENVPEFSQWSLYPAWHQAMRTLGYTLSPHILDSGDYGVPQNRRRLLIVGARSRKPLMLRPRESNRQPAIKPHLELFPGRDRWRVIDGTLAASTQERIAHGRKAHGQQFLICYYGNTLTARSLLRPIGTITTRDRWAIVDGTRMRMLSTQECRAAMGFPSDYLLPASGTKAKHLLGNAVTPPLITEVLNELRAAA
ncbi:MAG: DNA cytosine methyltransferase [Gammaproteobacteria bacterium]|nr:DNA cytosine methyltransferase [Gammaproteobacteria bacterium]